MKFDTSTFDDTLNYIYSCYIHLLFCVCVYGMYVRVYACPSVIRHQKNSLKVIILTEKKKQTTKRLQRQNNLENLQNE